MLKEVPANCTVVGVPGQIVKRDNVKVPASDMCQTDLPDPVMEDITLLQRENTRLTNRLLELEQDVKQLKAQAAGDGKTIKE